MRTQLTVTSPDGRQARQMVVDVDPATPVGEVLEAIDPELSFPRSSASMEPAHAGGTVLDPSARWDASGVLDGSVLRWGAAPAWQVREDTLHSNADVLLQIRVVAGAGAGTVYSVGAGKLSLGSDPACTFDLGGSEVPGMAALIEIDGGGRVVVRRAHAEAELQLNGQSVEQTVDWANGDTLRVHDVVFETGLLGTPHASLGPSDEPGRLDYNRPPRLFPPERQTTFRLPALPTEEARRSLPVLMALAPLALSVGMAIIMQRPAYLLFGLLSPVLMFANHYSSKKSGKLSHRERMVKYRQTKHAVESDAKDALTAFEREQRLLSPDPATSGLIATTPSPRLWERRRTDPDHLTLRLGVALLPSDVVVEDPEQVEHRRKVVWDAHDVPVTVSLAERGVIGLCGPEERVSRAAAWGVAQLAVTQSPRDVQFVVLTNPERAAEWEWVRWLPHSRPSDSAPVLAMIGSDAASVGQRINELSQVIDSRMKERAAGRDTARFETDIVVVLDGARRLRSWPGVAQILAVGWQAGVYSLCVDTEERLLPEECNAVFAPAADGSWELRQQRAETAKGVLADEVPWGWFEWVARALSPIRDASDDGELALPASARFLDVVCMEPPSPDAVATRWATAGRSTSAILGVSLDGPFAVDIRRDGPHALIAGTTGSGKSELLQTMVASLALANRPDAMTFVLVDYKGNATFKDFADLPHTLGIVTDLDTHLVERAMDSLSAELRRREHLLAGVGAKDIEDYLLLADRDPSMPTLARLVMVIDEFAAMKAELPEFVSGVVNIAQRGRSLGIHLVLATQRPSGAISADIRANTNLRIALRVSDPGESVDILSAPDAVRISKDHPGRGFVRSGATPLVPFQSGRVGGLRPDAEAGEPLPPHVVSVPWERLGEPVPAPTRHSTTQEELTDLVVLIEQISQAAKAMGILPQASPWLPPLPEVVALDDLLTQLIPPSLPTAGEPDVIAPIVYGLEDLPGLQLQRPLTIELGTFSHLFICGSARSGRSQALRTIAGSIVRSTAVDDVHLYGLDFGNGSLLPVAELPHCGAVVTRVQAERVQRLLDRLTTELARRQQLLAAAGFATISELRATVAPAERLPHIVVLFDQWEGFLSTLGEQGVGLMVEKVMNLLREGAPAGIHFIIAGDKQLLNPRMSSLVENKLILRFADRNDYSMAGLQPRKMPETVPDGRAFSAERAVESQIAVLAKELTGQGQAAALRQIGAAARERLKTAPATHRPFRLEALPTSIGFQEAWSARPGAVPPKWTMIGVGGDDLAAVGVDLAANPTFLIAGPARSGRSTGLMSMTLSAIENGHDAVVLAPRPSMLESLRANSRVKAVLGGADITPERLRQLLPPGVQGLVLAIDDAEAITDPGTREWLRDYVRGLRASGGALLVAAHIDDFGGSVFSGWEVDVKNNRHGALLAPSASMHGNLIGASLNRAVLGQAVIPGRAIVNRGGGELITVQIPQCGPAG